MPNSAIQSAPSNRLSASEPSFDLAQIHETLKATGVMIIQLGISDPEGRAFRQLVNSLGHSEVHDKSGTEVWDIKFDATADPATAARSRTVHDFQMHTDGSYEVNAPKFIGMYVVQEDRFGGGISRFIDTRKLLPLLSDETKQVLMQQKFRIRVPMEFFRGIEFIEAPLLDADGCFRFRKELIVREVCNPAQLKALFELELLLTDEGLAESMFLPTGTILLLDNRRFFHARTEIRDKERHLLRMRFS